MITKIIVYIYSKQGTFRRKYVVSSSSKSLEIDEKLRAGIYSG